MAKKDFSKVNTQDIYSTQIEEATQETPAAPAKRKERKTYTTQEAEEFLREGKTTGRKGLKQPRINVAFPTDLHEYITTMSRVRGESLTKFVQHVLYEHMEQHKDIYKKAIEFKNSL